MSRLAEVSLPGGLRRGAAQQPADGLLRPGPAGPRRPRARRRSAAGRRERQRVGLHAGAGTGSERKGGRSEEGEKGRRGEREIRVFTSSLPFSLSPLLPFFPSRFFLSRRASPRLPHASRSAAGLWRANRRLPRPATVCIDRRFHPPHALRPRDRHAACAKPGRSVRWKPIAAARSGTRWLRIRAAAAVRHSH